jgi:hypothetical protein
MAKIAAGGALTATSTAVAASSTATAAPTAKILVALAMVVAGGVGGTLAWRAQRTPAAPPALAPAPAPAPVIAPVAPAIVAAPEAPPAAPVTRPTASARKARPATHVEAPANRLAEETALLAAANGELRNGDARRALGLLDDYDRRYPSGVLREEVLATRVIARCQIGLAPDAAARRAANTFLSRHPASPLAPRVRSSCGR